MRRTVRTRSLRDRTAIRRPGRPDQDAVVLPRYRAVGSARRPYEASGRKKRVRLLRIGELATLSHMSDEGDLNEDLAAEVEMLLRDGTLEGLARRLRRDFPGLAAEAD